MTSKYILTQQQQRECYIIATMLSGAFSFARTPQGFDYWRDVRKNLFELAIAKNPEAVLAMVNEPASGGIPATKE